MDKVFDELKKISLNKQHIANTLFESINHRMMEIQEQCGPEGPNSVKPGQGILTQLTNRLTKVQRFYPMVAQTPGKGNRLPVTDTDEEKTKESTTKFREHAAGREPFKSNGDYRLLVNECC